MLEVSKCESLDTLGIEVLANLYGGASHTLVDAVLQQAQRFLRLNFIEGPGEFHIQQVKESKLVDFQRVVSVSEILSDCIDFVLLKVNLLILLESISKLLG